MADEKNNNTDNDDKYEKICYICRRPESKAGKMITLAGNMCVCPDCMQRTFDSMGQIDMSDMTKFTNMPFAFMDMGNVNQEIPKKQRVKKKEEKAEEAPAEEPVPEEAAEEESETVVEEAEPETDNTVIPFEASTEEAKAPEVREAENMDVDHLQQMIEETEDTDAESDTSFEDEDEEKAEESTEPTVFIVPDIDEESDEELDRIVDDYGTESKSEPKDIMFTKPKKTQDYREGFKLKFENIDSYAVDDSDDNYLDDLDDDDLDDDDGNSGLAGKLKGFFRK